SVAIASLIADEDPCPISITAITAATPMTTPRQVSSERIRLRRRASSAVRNVRRSDRMVGVPRMLPTPCPPVRGDLRQFDLAGRNRETLQAGPKARLHA